MDLQQKYDVDLSDVDMIIHATITLITIHRVLHHTFRSFRINKRRCDGFKCLHVLVLLMV